MQKNLKTSMETTSHNSVSQFSVRTLEFAGLGAALQALRLPFGKEPRSGMKIPYQKETFGEKGVAVPYGNIVLVDYDDLKLLKTLAKRGDEHAKVLRGVVVWCEINAPRYIWQEFDTYRVGAERLSSESTMHIEGRGLSEDELVEMKEKLEEGHMQKRVWMFSYQTLRRIYKQRHDHRLPQWRMFCGWIETLPLADELIIGDGV